MKACSNCAEAFVDGTDVHTIGGEWICAQCWDDHSDEIIREAFAGLEQREQLRLLGVKCFVAGSHFDS